MVNSVEETAMQERAARLAIVVAQRLLAGWVAKTILDGGGFKIVIHVQPGQSKAKIEWPAPADNVSIEESVTAKAHR